MPPEPGTGPMTTGDKAIAVIEAIVKIVNDRSHQGWREATDEDLEQLKKSIETHGISDEPYDTLDAVARKLAEKFKLETAQARKIVESVLDVQYRESERHADGRTVSFSRDWGGRALTITVDDAHTHAGFGEATPDQLIKSLYELLVEEGGLSWASAKQPAVADNPVTKGKKNP